MGDKYCFHLKSSLMRSFVFCSLSVAGSILEPVEPVDVLVCPTDSNLRHRGAISYAVAQAGMYYILSCDL